MDSFGHLYEILPILTHSPLCKQVYYISLCSSISIWLTPSPFAFLRSLWMPPYRHYITCLAENNFQFYNNWKVTKMGQWHFCHNFWNEMKTCSAIKGGMWQKLITELSCNFTSSKKLCLELMCVVGSLVYVIIDR